MATINDLSNSFANDAAADAGFIARGWAKSNGVMYYDTTFGQFKRWDATLSVWTIDTGGYNSFPGIQRTLFVIKRAAPYYTADGSPQFPYVTIQAALTAAAALGTPPSAANPVTILVYPGVYDESITAAAYVSLVGIGSAGSVIIAPTTTPAVILTIGAVERTFFSNLKFLQANNFAIVSATNAGADIVEGPVFDNCQFVGNDNAAAKVYLNGNFSNGAFKACQFEQPTNRIVNILHYDTSFAAAAPGLWGHYDCVFRGVVTCRGNAAFLFQGGSIDVAVSGQVTDYCLGAGQDSSDVFTVLGMSMRNMSATGTRYCISNLTEESKVVIGCDLEVVSTTGYEIGSTTATALVAGVLRSNYMLRGYSSDVQIADMILSVGVPALTDFYSTLANCLTAVAAMGATPEYTIVLYSDQVVANTNLTRDLTLDGRGIHAISVAGGGALFSVVTAMVRFRDVTVTGILTLAQETCELQLLTGTRLNGAVVFGDYAAQRVVLRHAQVFATAAATVAIALYHTSNYLRMIDSYIAGYEDYAVCDYSADSVSDCKWRGCTLFGDAATEALGISAAQTPHACAAHNRYEIDPWVAAGAATWTNDVASAQRFEALDANLNFDEAV